MKITHLYFVWKQTSFLAVVLLLASRLQLAAWLVMSAEKAAGCLNQSLGLVPDQLVWTGEQTSVSLNPLNARLLALFGPVGSSITLPFSISVFFVHLFLLPGASERVGGSGPTMSCRELACPTDLV